MQLLIPFYLFLMQFRHQISFFLFLDSYFLHPNDTPTFGPFPTPLANVRTPLQTAPPRYLLR